MVERGSGDGELAQAQAAIVGRHQTMTVNPKSLVAEALGHCAGKQRIQEYPATQNDGIQPSRAP
jgi:hypothetical protein